jgi:hypothetical protein
MGSFFLRLPPIVVVVSPVGGGGDVVEAYMGICIGNPFV